MSSTGIFGGSFNPVHNGHLALAECVREARRLDQVLFVPALHPPHKLSEPLAGAEHRRRMLDLALAGRPGLAVCAVELERDGPSYTLVTVRELRERFGARERLCLLVGGDMLADIPEWWHAGELIEEVEIVAVGRPGSPLASGLARVREAFGAEFARRVGAAGVEMEPVDVSASNVRARVRQGLPIEEMVPAAVADYILRTGLYRAG